MPIKLVISKGVYNIFKKKSEENLRQCPSLQQIPALDIFLMNAKIA